MSAVVSSVVGGRPQPARAGTSDDFVNVTLWTAQALAGLAFAVIGIVKLTTPIATLSADIRWAGEYPALFVRLLGVVDLAGGIGLVLPALTRILPGLTVAAAAGATLLQAIAIAFHVSRGEFAPLPLNVVLLPLVAYVLWGRSRAVPIAPLGTAAARRRFVSITLWAAQVGAAAVFCGAALAKLGTPIPELAKQMAWVGVTPPVLVRLVGLIDLAGGIGLVLPALTRIRPRLTVLAAQGCLLLQAFAIALHVSRGELSVLPLNAVLVALTVFVAWGRGHAAVIEPLTGAAARQRFLSFSLWSAQAAVALAFVGAGMFKISAPIPELAAAMKWPGDLPPAVVRLIGAIDLAGGLGILLPALTRIRPGLTGLAALGCAVLQALAICFHVSRGEWAMLPLNLVLLACASYVLWGRGRHLRVAPRS